MTPDEWSELLETAKDVVEQAYEAKDLAYTALANAKALKDDADRAYVEADEVRGVALHLLNCIEELARRDKHDEPTG